MLSRVGGAAFAAALVSITAEPVAAGAVRSFSVNPYSALLGEAAAFATGSFGNSGIILPGTDQSTFAVGLVLPSDYKGNSAVRINLIWRTSGTNCEISLLPDFVDRVRAEYPAVSGGSASGGLNAADGSDVLVAAGLAGEGHAKTYLLTGDPDQGFGKQLPGDAIAFGFFRRPTLPEDTCDADLIVSGINVIYSTVAKK